MRFYRNYIKQILADQTTLGIKLLFLFICVYLINSTADHPWIKMVVLCLALMAIVLFVKTIHQSLLWYIFLALFLLDLITNFYGKANHHFLLIYLTILIIQFIQNGRMVQLIANIKYLVVIVLLFSSLQKLMSPQFVTGDFYYYMFNTGKLFKPFLYFNQEMGEIIASNNSKILALGKSNPNTLESIHLQNIFPNIYNISLVFAWFTITLEFFIALLLLWKPKHNVTHMLYIILILGIFLTRLENGFLTLLAISGFWLAGKSSFRAVYLGLSILFMAFMIAKIGFY